MAQPDPGKDAKRIKRMADGIDLPEDDLKKMQIEMQIDLGLDLRSSPDEVVRLAREQATAHQAEMDTLLEQLKDKPPEIRERILEEIERTNADKSVFESASKTKIVEEPDPAPEPDEPEPVAEAEPVDTTRVDSKVALTVAEDGMHAWLSVTPPKNGGRAPNTRVLEEYLKRKGVIWGIDKKRLQMVVLEVSEKNRPVTDFEIATGRDVEEGQNAEIITKFEKVDPSEFRGTIDMTDVVAIGRAVKGMPLLQLKPAISGRNGMTVRGEEIKAADVKSLQIETRRNTKRAGDLIVPELDGIVYLYDSAILVKAYADAEVQIELDDEKMNAFVNLIPSVGDGLKLDMGIAREALTKAGITNGVNERMLEDAITKCEADKMPLSRLPVARGTKPVNGSDGKIMFKIRMQGSNEPVEKDGGRVDYREKDSIINIDDNTLIAVQFPAQKKISDGMTVTGETIPGTDGNPVDIKLGKNIDPRQNEKGHTEYYSKISGQVIFSDGLLDVEPLFVVEKNVDMTVGNIDFVGNVLVKGNVNDDFTVKAGGDIEVRGTVSAAHLIAGRDIYVKGGVIARSAGGLRAGNNVVVRFAENASIIANQTITIDRAAMLSEIAAGDSIICKKEKGQIIGGHTIARNLIEVKELGSSSGTKTEVTIGMDFFQMEQLNSLTEELQKFTRALEKIDGVLEKMEKARQEDGTLPEELVTSHTDLMQKKLLVQRKLHDIRKQKVNVLMDVADNRGGELIVLGTLYTDVKINLGKTSLETHEQRDRQHAHADPQTGKLIIEPWVPPHDTSKR
ncbi:MAG TPA: FapA family protein [Spirochaetota bacterium]|nr:FapA family protein [Spirochaetota bacterium]